MIKDFLLEYKYELLASVVTVVVLLFIRIVATKTIRRVGQSGDLHNSRTKLIIKYVSLGITAVGMVMLILIWGVNIQRLGLILSSIFAVIGVALFAQWSILSNITAGIILFLAFPFRIGDRIKILNNDLLAEEEYIIEDIRLYYIYLKNSSGHLITFPNNLMLQRGVTLVARGNEKKRISPRSESMLKNN